MFAFKASLVRFTLIELTGEAGWLFCPKLLLREKSAVHKNFSCWSSFRLKDLHEFIFAGGTIGNKFVSKFKMSRWEKMLLSIKIGPQYERVPRESDIVIAGWEWT